MRPPAPVYGMKFLRPARNLACVPCGLGARNTLRLEAKLPLYGHEISDTINVWEAGLDRFCKMEKPEFIGRAALAESESRGTETNAGWAGNGRARHCPRRLSRCLNDGGREIGYVTSGSPAPFLKKNIALAYVPPEFAKLGSTVELRSAAKAVKAQVVPTPFYKRPKKG